MRKLVLITSLASLTFVGVALAADPRGTVYEIDGSSVTTHDAGTSSKPVPTGTRMFVRASAKDGVRPTSPLKYTFSWTGIKENGKYFATCSPAQIDAQQSDSVCPKASLVAAGTFKGAIGPESDPASQINCEKLLHLYNGGAGKLTWYVYGDPSKCAGVGYFAPFPSTWVKIKGGVSEARVPVPKNITAPLPGIEGTVLSFDVRFKKLTKKVKGKTIGYLSSIGCGKTTKRKYSFSVTQKDGVHKTATDAGVCKK